MISLRLASSLRTSGEIRNSQKLKENQFKTLFLLWHHGQPEETKLHQQPPQRCSQRAIPTREFPGSCSPSCIQTARECQLLPLRRLQAKCLFQWTRSSRFQLQQQRVHRRHIIRSCPSCSTVMLPLSDQTRHQLPLGGELQHQMAAPGRSALLSRRSLCSVGHRIFRQSRCSAGPQSCRVIHSLLSRHPL